ncbi:MAG TPA: hypothetical protein VGR91_09665 [Stellaceae bacterium]|nr:hypothetical protein [Stellaceae bacterium]
MILSPDTVKSIGFWILVSGLFGDIFVLFMPAGKRKLEKTLGVIFTLIVIIGVAIDKIGDKLTSSALSKIECAQSEMTSRHLTPNQQKTLVDVLSPFRNSTVNIWVFSGGRGLEKVGFAVALVGVFRRAGWKTNGVSTQILPAASPAPNVTIRYRANILKNEKDTATELVKLLNSYCIKSFVSMTPFINNGDFGRTIRLDKAGEHLAPENIFGPKPLKHPDFSILVGEIF